jgi:hypothetical protein
VGCFAHKHGRFADGSCTVLDEPKGKPKGKFEQGLNGFSASGGAVKFEVQGSATIECTSSSAEGQPRDPKQGIETITYTGCKRLSSQCQSIGEQPGAIRSLPLESYTYEEAGKIYTVLGGNPIAVFLCGNAQFVLSGVASGEVGGDLNAMSATSQSTFKAGVGEQALSITEGTGAGVAATLISSMQTAVAQPLELKARP